MPKLSPNKRNQKKESWRFSRLQLPSLNGCSSRKLAQALPSFERCNCRKLAQKLLSLKNSCSTCRWALPTVLSFKSRKQISNKSSGKQKSGQSHFTCAGVVLITLLWANALRLTMFSLTKQDRQQAIQRSAISVAPTPLQSVPIPRIHGNTRTTALQTNTPVLVAPSTVNKSKLEWWQRSKPLLKDWPSLGKRNNMHNWLEKLGYKRGMEVGFFNGRLAKVTLSTWVSCEEYNLVEPGLEGAEADLVFQAKQRLKKWENIVHFYPVGSAAKFQDGQYDYIYIGEPHDYCSVVKEMEVYWPKIRPGGILAGHGFVDAASAKTLLKEDWSLCKDGTFQPRAVKGGVEDFAKKLDLTIVTTLEDFATWIIQKPYQVIR